MPRYLLLAAVALIALSALPARAQVTGHIPNTGYDTGINWGAIPMDYGSTRTPEDLVRTYEIEQRYRETMRTRIPDRKPSNDPWRNLRAAPAPDDRHRVQ